ncbi:MAG: hypothetical protein A2882_11310 [Phenylobacterium sp. RIFCSPHIGHO2_01_FULL_70_10]|nr:MAG: hypothetical protein A2882_11310 [Phenylobacterium sp. RIFCSPHIGHO2_01_FULL_70_10]
MGCVGGPFEAEIAPAEAAAALDLAPGLQQAQRLATAEARGREGLTRRRDASVSRHEKGRPAIAASRPSNIVSR